MVGNVLQQIHLPARVVDEGITTGDAQRADGLCPRIKRYADPGEYAFLRRQNIARLALAHVILCKQRASFSDDILREAVVGRQGVVFIVLVAVAALDTAPLGLVVS